MKKKDTFSHLTMEQMQKNVALSMKRHAEEARLRKTPEVIAKKIMDFDSGPPIFLNPILNELYIQDISISDDTIAKILSLPREDLINDLIKIIYDSIFRYPYFSETKEENLSTWQLPHAVFLLKELEAEEALEPILDFLSQGRDLFEFWLGDILTQEISMVIVACGKNNLERLSEFVKEPNRYTYSRAEISDAVNQMAQHNIISKEQALNWYKDLLEFFLINKENDDVIDTDLNGFILSDILDLQGKELLPLIEQMFKLNLINREICGDWKDAQKEISKPLFPIKAKEKRNISQIYNGIKKWSNYNNSQTKNNSDDSGVSDVFDEFEFENNSYQEPIVRSGPKIGRNDPCTCGSGKKYKKCCGSNAIR